MNSPSKVTLFVAAGAFTHYLAADFLASAHGNHADVPAPPRSAVVVAVSSTAAMQFDTVLGREVKAVPLDLRRFEIIG
jgi:hypothetical protein